MILPNGLPPMLGLVGAAGAGKDEVASALFDAGALQYSSGDPIRELAIASYSHGVDRETARWMYYTQEGKKSTHPYLKAYFVQSTLSLDREKWDLVCFEDDDRAVEEYHEGAGYRGPLQSAPMTNREVLELLGDKMISADRIVLMRPMLPLAEETGRMIVDTSTREEAQAVFIRSHGGLILYVRNPVAEAKAGTHQSATFWARTEYSIQLTNDPTRNSVQDLRDTAVRLYHDLPRLLQSRGPFHYIAGS